MLLLGRGRGAFLYVNRRTRYSGWLRHCTTSWMVPVRFPMDSLGFFIDLSFRPHHGPGVPTQVWAGPWGSRRLPEFLDTRHMKVVRLSAVRTSRLYHPGNTHSIHFCWRLSRPQTHSASRRNKSMKNLNDPIRNGTHDNPGCSAVPQPTEISTRDIS